MTDSVCLNFQSRESNTLIEVNCMPGVYGSLDWKAVIIQFDVARGNLLRATKEYNLVFIPEMDEWFGDVIAYGQWWDLGPEEVACLREKYGLDTVMERAIKGLHLC